MKESAPVILVIEDYEDIAALAFYYLRRANYQPILARHGMEGLRLARDHSPALILCDAGLPELNGLELLAVLRCDPLTARIPFVLMSGLVVPRCIYPMPAAFLPKPFQEQELLAVVQGCLDPVAVYSQRIGSEPNEFCGHDAPRQCIPC